MQVVVGLLILLQLIIIMSEASNYCFMFGYGNMNWLDYINNISGVCTHTYVIASAFQCCPKRKAVIKMCTVLGRLL